MVEGAPLLREYTGDRIEGSNPFLSAISKLSALAPVSPKQSSNTNGKLGRAVTARCYTFLGLICGSPLLQGRV